MGTEEDDRKVAAKAIHEDNFSVPSMMVRCSFSGKGVAGNAFSLSSHHFCLDLKTQTTGGSTTSTMTCRTSE